MQFLRMSPLQMKQKKRVEHWLLMMLRMLAILVLALLLARPRLPQGDWIPRQWTDAPVDVAVVIDHSLSTGRMARGKTVFDQAVINTSALLDQLKSTDSISVVYAEHKPRALIDRPVRISDSSSITQLRQQLIEEKQGTTDCSIPEAINLARQLLANGRSANKTIIVMSDQQRSNWHIKDVALWNIVVGQANQFDQPAVHVFPIVPDAEMSNASVGPPAIEPAILGVNRPLQITSEISNTGSKPIRGLTAQLIVNNKIIDTKPVPPLQVKSSASIRFDLPSGLSEAGSTWIKVSVNTDDALIADNSAVAAANVLDRIPVLVIDGQLSEAGSYKSSRFLAAAMQPSDPSLVQASIVSIAGAMTTRLDDYRVVILNDLPVLPGSLRDRLADYTRSGRGLWIILGPRTQQATIEKQMAGLFTAQVHRMMSSPNAPSGLEVKNANNPIVKLVASDEHNALVGALTRKWWAMKPADTSTILSAGNGDPLVMERPMGISGGMIDIWASSVDGSWNNWNLMPNFVPLVNETIYRLCAASMHGLENGGIEAGQPIEWAGPANPAVNFVQITLPDNSSVTRPATFNHGRWMLTDADTFLPGIYKLQFSPPEIPTVYYGVNIDHTELDPTALDSSDLTWLESAKYLSPALPVITSADLPDILRRRGQPPEIWGILAGVLLLNLLLETFLTYRLVTAHRRVDVAGAGLLPGSF